MFPKIICGYLELFVSKEVQATSCLSALNMRVAGAKLEMANAKIWPEAQTSRALRGGQKS